MRRTAPDAKIPYLDRAVHGTRRELLAVWTKCQGPDAPSCPRRVPNRIGLAIPNINAAVVGVTPQASFWLSGLQATSSERQIEGEKRRTHWPDLAFQMAPAVAIYSPSGLHEAKTYIPRVVQRAAFRMAERKQVVPFPTAMVCFALQRQMTNQLLLEPRDVALFQVGLPRDDLGIVLVEPGLISLVDGKITLIDGFVFFLRRDQPLRVGVIARLGDKNGADAKDRRRDE